MKNKKLSESLDRSMADVSWKEQNRLRVWNGIRNAEPARSRAPRRISVVIAFALVLVLGMATALAAFNEDINQMLYQWWPEAALALRPVNLSFEEAGIRLDVLSASVIDDEMLVTFTLTDRVGDGRRINENTECEGALSGDIVSEAGSSTELISYDPEKHQATYVGHTEYIPVSGDNFVSDNKIYINIHGISNPSTSIVDLMPLISGLDYPVETVPLPVQTPVHTGYIVESSDTPVGDEYPPILNPENNLKIPVAFGVELSGAGWVDGVLHIQIHDPQYLIDTPPDSGFFEVVRVIQFLNMYNPATEEYPDEKPDSYPFHVKEMGWKDNNGGIWYEYFFPFSPEEMESYRIFGEFTQQYANYRELMNYDWTVEFPISMVQIQNNN